MPELAGCQRTAAAAFDQLQQRYRADSIVRQCHYGSSSSVFEANGVPGGRLFLSGEYLVLQYQSWIPVL